MNYVTPACEVSSFLASNPANTLTIAEDFYSQTKHIFAAMAAATQGDEEATMEVGGYTFVGEEILSASASLIVSNWLTTNTDIFNAATGILDGLVNIEKEAARLIG